MQDLRRFDIDCPGLDSHAKLSKLLASECPEDLSYAQWKIGKAQIPRAYISYSWLMPWATLIAMLEAVVGAGKLYEAIQN